MGKNKISNTLFAWYSSEKRDLPWRNTTDPYRIWVSEIILQQTRVAQGLDYYLRFVDRFPDVQSLAGAHEDEVLKHWQGLGYYSRARNLHTAARSIMEVHQGVFPVNYKAVRALKGVGEYTAAAICSFAFHMPYATVDGNVYRVLARLFDIDLPIDGSEGKRFFGNLAQELLSERDPATHNQAMMEFGALQCVPKNPDCKYCPFQEMCMAHSSGRVALLPTKGLKTKVKNRYFNYFRIRLGNSLYLSKRTENDIWRNLYEFPMIETSERMDFERLSLTPDFQRLFSGIGKVDLHLAKTDVVHVLSHRRIVTAFYEASISNENDSLKNYLCIAEKDFDRYAVSQLTHLLAKGTDSK